MLPLLLLAQPVTIDNIPAIPVARTAHVATATAAHITAPLPVDPRSIPEHKMNGLVSGHWTCYQGVKACTLDPSPLVQSPINDPGYYAQLNLQLCEVKPWNCRP